MASVYEPIVPNLKGVPAEAEFVAKKVEEWLFAMGCDKKLSDFGFSQGDVDNLVDLALETPSLGLLLSMSPVKATKEVIKKIYEESLYPMK